MINDDRKQVLQLGVASLTPDADAIVSLSEKLLDDIDKLKCLLNNRAEGINASCAVSLSEARHSLEYVRMHLIREGIYA